MNKQAFLEETYNSAFNDELEKIALSQGPIVKAMVGRLSGVRSSMLNPDKVRKTSGSLIAGTNKYTKSDLKNAVSMLQKKTMSGKMLNRYK